MSNIRPVRPLAAVPAGGDASLSLVTTQPEPRNSRLLALCVVAALLPRVIAFFFNENFFGDAVIRTELAERWLYRPHWISSFKDGAFQFGPLHIYLIGIALKIYWWREHAGRVVSLLFGVATVFPLFNLTRRLFGWRAAVVSCFALASWGMHVQFSTTACSEAVGLFLVAAALDAFASAWEDNRFGPLAGAALLLNLACATRYDYWILPPLLTLLLWRGDKDRVAAITRAVLFGLLCLPFPLVWLQGNEVATHDALYPIHFIDQFHQQWVKDAISFWGEPGFRAMSAFFWPGAALLTLTPLVALFGVVGVVVAWKARPEHRWLIWVLVVPTLLFTLRAAVLLSFMPLARFTALQLLLLLPFVKPGFDAVTRRLGTGLRRSVAIAAAALAIAVPLALGIFTYGREGKYETSLKPVSPISTNPPEVMQVAHFVREEVLRRGGSLILDSDPVEYTDLQIAFFGGLKEPQMARHRWEDFPKVLAKLTGPQYLVRLDHGTLNQVVKLEGSQLEFNGERFEEIPGFRAPYHVYRRL